MFERFTDRSRRVVVLAQEEARFLNHDYIGTEHLLLGLIHEGEGLAAKVLTDKCGINLQQARDEVEKEKGKSEHEPRGHIPFSPRCKKVLELALREALRLDVNYIGTEHLLLGLLRQDDATGVKLLTELGTNADEVRQEVYDTLGVDEHGNRVLGKRQKGVPVSSLNLTELNGYIKEYEEALRQMRARRDQLISDADS